MSTFQFELVSPEKKLISEPAYMVNIPGEEGEFGVLAGHASLVASVKAGVVKIWKTEGSAPEKIFIAGGFADVTAENCTVLAEEAVPLETLDRGALETQLTHLREDLNAVEGDLDRARVLRRIDVAEAKLAAISA